MNNKPQNLPRLAAGIALLLCCVAPPAFAAISVNPHGQFGGWPASIAVPPGGGQYIYSGEGSGLGVWDVTDKANPAVAGGLPLGGTDVSEIQFDATGQTAYVANGSGLKVISLADPDNPTVLGSLATSGTSLSVAVVNATYVLVATSAGGNGWIRVVNVSDPANPTDVGGYDTPGSAQHVFVAGNCAYVADGTAGLLVLDITTPATPQLLGSYNTPGNALRVQVVGTIAYVADGGGSGLQVLNVATPSNISPLPATETDSYVVDIQVAGTTAYTVDRNTGNLHVLNIAIPSAPVRSANTNLGWEANRIAVSGNYAYVAGRNGLIIVNVATPSNPTVAGTYERPTEAYGGTFVGTTGYIADESRLWVCNFANPAVPAVLGKCDLGHTSFWSPYPRVSVSGNYAAVAKRDYGMVLVNVATPNNPTVAGHFSIPGGVVQLAMDVSLNGTLACLLTRSNSIGRLRLINIANPANPTEVGALDTPGDGRRLAVLGNLAAVADGAGGVRLINIANPAAPVEAGHIDPPTGTVADVVTLENHPTTGHPWLLVMFNAGTGWQMKAYDALNPAAPVFINELLSATGHINDLQMLENRAYLAGSIEIVNPVTQFLLYIAALQDPSVDVIRPFRVGNFVYLFIFDHSWGLHVYVVVDVQPGPLARIDVTPNNVTLGVGDQQQFTAKGYDANNNEVPITTTWTATGGTITQGGLYTAGSTAGNFTVTASVSGSPVIGTGLVHVSSGPLARIDVTPGNVNLEVGDHQQFTATGYDANNNQVPITNPQWSTSGGGTLTPNGSTCTYTAGTTPGNFTVTCQQDSSGIQDTANVQVYQGKAKLISPVGGTTFGNGTATFTWIGNSGVTRFALWVGSSPNSHDLYARVETGLSRTLALPTDGRPIYVTLWAWFNNAWERGDALIYTAATTAKARMLSPTNPSTLPSGTPTFIWDTGVGVSQYALWVGNGPRTYDLYARFQSDLSETVRLSTDGRTIYVTLWSFINGAWQANDYTYTAYMAPRAASQILSPTNGATLPGGPTTFIWDTGASVTQRALWVGNNPHTYDLYVAFEPGLSRTITLPTDGRTIYVTLWSLIRGTWLWNHYQYTSGGGAAPGPAPAQMLSPTNGTTLSGPATTFIWDMGSRVRQRALWVGSTPQTWDLYAGWEWSQARTLTLPTDGRTLHVTLWSRINGVWQSNAYTYTAYTGVPAKMLSPLNETTLGSAVTTFIWDTGVGVAQRALWVGSNPNTHDLYANFEPGQSRTLWLPVDGRTLHVTLWSWMHGSWQSNAYTYQAFGP